MLWKGSHTSHKGLVGGHEMGLVNVSRGEMEAIEYWVSQRQREVDGAGSSRSSEIPSTGGCRNVAQAFRTST